MAEKHTEGPWEYVPSTEHHGPYVSSYAGDVADCYVMSNPTAASVRNGGDSYPVPHCGEQADANARLIASAPDMLAALRKSLSALERYECEVAGEGETPIAHRDMMEFVRSTIAAATGEAP